MSPTTAIEWVVGAIATRENGLTVEKNVDGIVIADFRNVPLEMQAELRERILQIVSLYPDITQVQIVNEAELNTIPTDTDRREQGGNDFIAA